MTLPIPCRALPSPSRWCRRCVSWALASLWRIRSGLGSRLLFITNALAILLAGGGVLALLGLSSAAFIDLEGSSRRTAFTAVLIGVLVVMVPLTLTGRALVSESLAEAQTRQVADAWTAGTDFEVRNVNVVGSMSTSSSLAMANHRHLEH